VHLFSEKIYRSLTKEKGIFTTKIACIRRFAGKQELYVMDFDGFNPRRITNNGSINVLPAWSPNGKYIAYTSYKARNPDIYVLNIGTGRSKKVSKYRGLNSGAAWSPDGSRIAYSASRGRAKMDIYVTTISGGSTTCLTCGHSPRWASHLSPSWSPDGSKITYVSTSQGSPQIFVMSSSGGSPKRLTVQGKYNQSPKWSPKGDAILFTGRDEKNIFDIFTISPTTGRVISRITQRQGNNVESAWSTNGRNIVYSSTRSGFPKLFISRSDGKNSQQITFMSGKFVTPTWSPPFAK
jgi:TolB protein